MIVSSDSPLALMQANGSVSKFKESSFWKAGATAKDVSDWVRNVIQDDEAQVRILSAGGTVSLSASTPFDELPETDLALEVNGRELQTVNFAPRAQTPDETDVVEAAAQVRKQLVGEEFEPQVVSMDTFWSAVTANLESHPRLRPEDAPALAAQLVAQGSISLHSGLQSSGAEPATGMVAVLPAASLSVDTELDVAGTETRSRLLGTVQQLKDVTDELASADALVREIERAAVARTRRSAALFGLSLMGFNGFLVYEIFEVSWDVMEPLSYFLSTFYTAVGYSYFLMAGKEPANETMGDSYKASVRDSAVRAAAIDGRTNQTTFADLLTHRAELKATVGGLVRDISTMSARLGPAADA